MNITRTAGDDHPQRVDAHRVGQPLAGCIERIGHGRGWQHQQGREAQTERHGSLGTAHGSSWVECAPQSVGRRAGASFARCRKIDPPHSPSGRGAPSTRANDALPILRRLDKVHASLPPLGSSCIPTHATQSPNQEDLSRPWHAPASRTSPRPSGAANGAALGAPDLTEPGSYPFGENVFNLAVQRERLPKDVFRQLQATLDRGEALDPSLADAVAKAMRSGPWSSGATHFTHWFQPLTGLDGREARLLLSSPTGDGTRDRRVLRQGADPGRAGRLLVPDGRHARDLRGARLHRVGPDVAGVPASRTPTARCCASRRRSRRGPARRSTTKIPLLRSMDALSTRGRSAP